MADSKIQGNDNLLDYVNNIKVLTYQLVCLEVFVREEAIVMILLKNLLVLYEYLIIVIKIDVNEGVDNEIRH